MEHCLIKEVKRLAKNSFFVFSISFFGFFELFQEFIFIAFELIILQFFVTTVFCSWLLSLLDNLKKGQILF